MSFIPSYVNGFLSIHSIEQIENEFKFFPRLHKIFAARPNVTPIAITTALGPNGRKTVWYQPPDDDPPGIPDSAIDPQLLAISHPPPSAVTVSTPARGFGHDITAVAVNSSPVAIPVTPSVSNLQEPLPSALTAQRAPKSSSVSQEAIEKARQNILRVPQKRTLLDTLLEIQE